MPVRDRLPTLDKSPGDCIRSKGFFFICRSHIPQSPIFCRPAGSWSTLFVQCLKSLLRIGRRGWILSGTELRGRDSVDAYEGSWSIWYAEVYLVHSAGSDAVQTRYAKATGQFEMTSCNLLFNSEMISQLFSSLTLRSRYKLCPDSTPHPDVKLYACLPWMHYVHIWSSLQSRYLIHTYNHDVTAE